MAYATGKRICDMVREDMRPSRILTREAFENAIVVASALGASSNCPPHLIAMARHAGIDLSLDDWQRLGEDAAAGQLRARRRAPGRGLSPRRRRARRAA